MGSRQALKFKNGSFEKLTPELVVRSMWMSTALAMIFAVPPVGLFIGLYQSGVNIAIATGIGFGIHFAILVFSKKISSSLIKLFED